MPLNTLTLALANQIQSPTLTAFSKIIAVATEPLIILILAILISITFYLKNKKSQAILLASTSIITALVITILKNLFRIPRPDSMLIKETGYALPSGHVTFAIVFFGLLVFLFTKPKHKIAATITSIFLILIIAFTRLYLQVHWLTDILSGLIIGSIILTTSILIYKKEIFKKR
ncbi:phosphatase PAP2 family protein [Candidatus Pacearchaeota archaeon]|nr:phosphatase PAP2 family protein [Candidatus Pacearchaeota archaeon]